MSVKIRRYEPKDRVAVRRLFGETAFHGRSYTNFFNDGEWLADVMTASYTDLEPLGCFVAEDETGVVGYLTGTLNSEAHSSLWRKQILAQVVTGFFAGGTWKSLRAWKFFWHGLVSAFRGEQRRPKDLTVRFPAHFHINVDERYRNQKIGAALIDAFFAHMRSHGVGGVHVRTSSREPHQRFFEARGFQKLYECRLTTWHYLGEPDYHLMAYGLNLKP